MLRQSPAAYRWSIALFVVGVGVPVACGPDSRPPKPCGDEPDFVVQISAVEGPLPASTKVIVTYGSGREEYAADAPTRPEILFCDVTDEDGVPIEAGAQPGAGTGGAGSVPSEGEGGSAGLANGSGIAGLRCTLWTQGPATVEVVAEGYPELREDLRREEDGTCTLTKELELLPEPDAGI